MMTRQNTVATKQRTKSSARILSVTLILALILTAMALPASAATNPFRDVKTSDYFYQPVLWAVDKGVTAGTTPTTFSPSQTCTRAQAMTFLWNAAGRPEPTGSYNPFKDVPSNQYYYKAVLWAVEKKITAGTSKTTFGSNQGCTRGQIMTFIWNYAGQPSGVGVANPFKDVPGNQYYYQPVLWAVGKGITAGTAKTTYSPNQTCTRGQIMTFLYNYEVKVKGASGGQQTATPAPAPTPAPTPVPTPTPAPEKIDTNLKPPQVLGTAAHELTLQIHLEGGIFDGDGKGYQVQIARDAGFTKEVQTNNEDREWNHFGYVNSGFFYVSGTFYYRVRAYREQGSERVYGPWSSAGTVTTMNFSRKLQQSAQYSYEVYFLDDLSVYSGLTGKAVYIKTNNPDASSIGLYAGDENILGSVHVIGEPNYYDDVDYLKIDDTEEELRKVTGGYIGILDIDDPGNYSVEVRESTSKGYTIAKTFSLTVKDYELARAQWIDQMLAKVTTEAMTPLEKMKAVEQYLISDEAGFKYVTVDKDDHVVVLAAVPNSPWFETHRWDSATSPSMLKLIAEKIGGFEEIHNCYGDYARGSSDWWTYHHKIYVVYKGQKTYFTVCPVSSTGRVTVSKIDFTNTGKFHWVA